MFFQLFEHSDLIGSKLSLSVSGAHRQDSNAGGLVSLHGVPIVCWNEG